MRRLLLLAILCVSAAFAADDQAFFAIEAETSSTKMVGMPEIKLPAGMPPGFQLPPSVMAMMSGAPTRKLNLRLWSPSIAPQGATASVVPPAGLKQGNKLVLELYRPKPDQTEDDDPPGLPGVDNEPGKPQEMVIKLYWGSSKTVKPGQPKVIRLGDMATTGPDQAKMAKMAEAQAAAAAAAAGGGYFYKAGWTTAYWPTKAQPGQIDPAAALPGSFALTTNYTGNVTLDVPADVNFLDPFTLTSPKLDKKPDLTKFIDLSWQPIASLLGSQAQMIAFEGKNTIIIWSSSEVEDFPHMSGFLQMAEVRQMVAERKFMAPETTQVFIPAGIFAKANVPMLSVHGWGKGTAVDNAQPRPRLQTKVSLMVNFMAGGPGGPGMPDMGGMGMDDDEEEDN